MDVWGPSPMLSHDGYHYYLSIVDAFSQYTWLFPLRMSILNLLNFRNLLNDFLIFTFRPHKLMGDGNFNLLPLIFNHWVFLTVLDVLVHINSRALLSGSTVILLRHVSHSLPLLPCPNPFELMLFRLSFT